ncbi:MAG: NAD(P)H-binding protein [Bacillota bacterium]
MKVLVVGVNGRVGSRLVDNLVKNGHDVYAGTRRDNLPSNSSNVRYAILIYWLVLRSCLKICMMQKQFSLWLALGGKDLLKIDLNGAVKVMLAAEKKKIKRFIMLSSVFFSGSK